MIRLPRDFKKFLKLLNSHGVEPSISGRPRDGDERATPVPVSHRRRPRTTHGTSPRANANHGPTRTTCDSPLASAPRPAPGPLEPPAKTSVAAADPDPFPPAAHQQLIRQLPAPRGIRRATGTMPASSSPRAGPPGRPILPTVRASARTHQCRAGRRPACHRRTRCAVSVGLYRFLSVTSHGIVAVGPRRRSRP